MTTTPLRFTFVIARYGSQVLGGAERLGRSVAERLAARGHHVRILTSCARSYRTWANEYAPGTTIESGVEIERHRVARGRLPGDEALKWLSSVLPAFSPLARAWARAQGPLVPGLVACLPEEARQRDLLVFFQLLSYPTLFGLPLVARSSVLVPLVHKERGVGSTFARRTLALPQVLFANTSQEAAMIASLGGAGLPPVRIAAVGLEPPPSLPERSPAMPQPYVTAMGRAGKLKPLLRTWQALTTNAHLPPLRFANRDVPWRDVHLVIVGERSGRFRAQSNVIQTGYVDDATRWDILRGAVALVNPSLYQSLSLVLLEAWTVGCPVVVNAGCDVTADLVRRSRGGVIVDFDDPSGAAAMVAADLEQPLQREEAGRRGAAFAAATFVWDRVLDEYESAAQKVASV